MEGLKTQIEILKQLCMFAIFTETKRKSAFLPLLLSEALSGSEMMIPLCDGWGRQTLLSRERQRERKERARERDRGKG